MHVEHFEKGLRYSDRELLVLAKKIGKLATYCKKLKDESSVIRVEADRRPTKKKRDEVEVTVTVELPRARLTSTSRKEGVLEAVDRAVEKIEPQLLRYKDKHTGKDRARRDSRKGGRRERASDDSFSLAA
jgi:ribosomal subunit interface protein